MSRPGAGRSVATGGVRPTATAGGDRPTAAAGGVRPTASGGEPRVERLALADVTPSLEALLAASGVPAGIPVSDRARAVAARALERVRAVDELPVVSVEVDGAAFGAVFEGAADNAAAAPLAGIYPAAERLTLFALTLGEAIGAEIQAAFAAYDLAYASLLDSAASLAAQNAVTVLEERFGLALDDPNLAVLAYSPGYCGWALSGQVPLFARLDPGVIGISLNDSFLMQPLKSVSGVLVAAAPAAHAFANRFDFCEACTTKSCRERLERLGLDPVAAGG